MTLNNALIITPTYNEKENITFLIDAVMALPVAFDMLIVDDGSPDGTAQLVKEKQLQYNSAGIRIHLMERKGKMGLGTAYIAGFQFALEKNYQYVMEMDADFSHDPKDLTRLYSVCAENGFDLAVGSRYVTGVNVVNWPIGRILLSYFASRYVRLITGMPIFDTTAGFVCYRRKVLSALPLKEIKFLGYAFQIEMKFLTWKYGFRMKEVPIIFYDRTRGQSKMSVNIFKEAFWGVIQMTVQSWFKKYPKQEAEKN